MEHQEAIETKAAERYLLGELSGAERDGFEEHFFDCQACAENVRAGAIFQANARAVLSEQVHRQPVKVGVFEWLRVQPAFAAALAGAVIVLAGAVSYQALVVQPRLRSELAELAAPQPYPSFFLHSVTRGEEQAIVVAKASRFFGLSLDLVPGQDFPSYVGEVVSESGTPQFSVLLPASRTPDGALHVLIPASRLEPGRYSLVIRGNASSGQAATEVATYHFLIQRS